MITDSTDRPASTARMISHSGQRYRGSATRRGPSTTACGRAGRSSSPQRSHRIRAGSLG